MLYISLILTMLPLMFSLACQPTQQVHPIRLVTTEATSVPIPAEEEMPIRDFALSTMQVCGAALSETRSRLLAEQIERVVERQFQTRSAKEAFVYLICIESKFNALAKSSAGAVGLTQVIPKYAQEFANACSLGRVDTSDLMDSEVNLQIGGCWFAVLVERHGSIALALAAYNAGTQSEAVKQLKKLGSINAETANYLAKYITLVERGIR